ncbi:anti-phage ZorAB system protein ZorA [Cystobacter ferrugineus]|uniref:Uncharacterized protein n=1 Tax=Cystobacter ferrugineus TaxID=83449 RepID=A0A1L9ATQ9_9BACT|nr:anti-phage ZorAB system protein ZorA [Cystobacter ferrugineus]OJH33407.1 hypothetical protein BON30_48840 [Cystobacter ferrugineus]
MEAIAHFLVQEWLAYALIGFIIAVSVFTLGRFWWQLRPVRKDLRRAREIIESVPDASAFFMDFDRVSDALRQLPIMGHAWKEFEESLVVPGEREGATTVLNSKEPAAHFHLETLLVGRVATRFYEAFPNLLVGFGILWTFLGLAGGIHLAVPGLSSDDVAQLKGGLRDLLGGAFLAFAKSAFAIACSLLFTGVERWWMGATDKLLEDCCAALDERLTLETPEKLAGLQLEELRKQTMELKLFNTGMGAAMAQALEERVGDRLAPVLERLVESVHQLRADRGDSTERYLATMLEEFKKSMSQAAGGEFTAMAEAVSDLRGVLDRTAASMEAGQRQFETSTARIADSLEQTLGVARRGVQEELTHLTQAVNASLNDSASRLSSQLELGGRALAEQVAAQGQQFIKLTNAIETALSQSAKNLSSQMEGGGRALAEQMALQGQHLVQLTQSIQGALDQSASNLSSQLESGGRALAGQMNSQTQQLTQGLVRLESLTAGWGELLARTSELVGQVRDASTVYDSSFSSFRSIASEMNTAGASIRSASERLSIAASAQADSTQRLEGASAHVTESLRRAAETWEQYRQRFEAIDQSLGNAFRELDLGLTRYGDKVADYVRQLEGHMSKATTSLSLAVGSLHEGLSELPDEVNTLGKHVESLKRTVEATRR